MYTAVSIPGETGPVTSASLGSAIENGGRDRGCQLRHPASKCRTAPERLSVCGTGRHQSCDRLAPIRNCDFVSLSDQWSAASSAPTTSARCQGKNVGATATRAMLPILKDFRARKSMHGSTSATRELRVIWESPRKEKGTTGLVRQRCWINSCVRHRTTTLEERPTLTSRMIALKPRTLPPGRTPKGGLHLILTLWFAARIRAAQCADPVSSTPRSLSRSPDDPTCGTPSALPGCVVRDRPRAI